MRKFALLALLFACQVQAGGLIATVPFDTNSNILRIPLYDQDTPDTCPSTDLTISTAGLRFDVSTDVTNGFYDQFQQSDSTLETITTIGTFATPTATKARFKVVTAGSCWYELQLPDAAFSQTSANKLYIEVSDGATEILDDTFWVDLTVVAASAFVDSIWTEPTTGYTTASTFGESVGVDLEAVRAAVVTSIPATLSTIATDTTTDLPTLINALESPILWSGAIDSITSQTVIKSDDGPLNDSTHVGRSLCIADASTTQDEDCAVITAYDYNAVGPVFTWTIANALDFTVAATDAMYIPAVDVFVAKMGTAVVDATAVATDAMGAAEWASDATTEVQSGLATASALTTVDDFIDTEIANIQGRLPTSLVSGRIDASIGAAQTAVITADSIATDAIGSPELATTAVDEIITAVNARTVESGLTGACHDKAIAAVLYGTYTMSGSTATFKDPSGSTTRVAITYNGSSRTNVNITCP